MLESLEKLRELAADINAMEIVDHMELYPSCVFDGHWLDTWHREFDRLLEAIQEEVEEKYMLLPVDADGVPIRVGDEMTSHGDVFMVCAVAPAKIHLWVTVKLGEPQTTYSYDPRECTHYKPRTVEDVLREFADEATDIDGRDDEEWLPLLAKYAQELRMVGE